MEGGRRKTLLCVVLHARTDYTHMLCHLTLQIPDHDHDHDENHDHEHEHEDHNDHHEDHEQYDDEGVRCNVRECANV